MRVSRRLVPFVLVGLLTACVPTSSTDGQPAGTAGQSPPSAPTGAPVPPGSMPAPARADPATCAALAPVGTKSAAPTSVEQARTARDAAPPGLEDPLQRLVEWAEQANADPETEVIELLARSGWPKVEVLLRDSQAVQDWHRRHCGPPGAGSRWCEAFATATLDRNLALLALTLSTAPGESFGPLLEIIAEGGRQSLRLYQAIIGEAPPELVPSVQLLIDQYGGNDRLPSQEPAAVSAREAAQDAIIRSVGDQCGMEMTRSGF